MNNKQCELFLEKSFTNPQPRLENNTFLITVIFESMQSHNVCTIVSNLNLTHTKTFKYCLSCCTRYSWVVDN